MHHISRADNIHRRDGSQSNGQPLSYIACNNNFQETRLVKGGPSDVWDKDFPT